MKKTNKIGVILGIAFIYVGIYNLVNINSNNLANKDFTYINKINADLNFYHDKNGINTYTGTEDLENGKWSSNEFPNKTYSKIKVTQQKNKIQQVDIGIKEVILPIRHSH